MTPLPRAQPCTMSKERVSSEGPLRMVLQRRLVMPTDLKTASKHYRVTKGLTQQIPRRSERIQSLFEQPHNSKAGSPQRDLPSPQGEDFRNTGKSKRKRGHEESGSVGAKEPPRKQQRSDGTIRPVIPHSSIVEQSELVKHWTQNQCEWSSFLKETVPMDDRRSGSQKRSLSRSSSYRQSTISGDTPKAWGSKHAAIMLENGIYMEKQDGITISEEDKRLCKDIVETSYELPKEWRFEGENFQSILKAALYKNERRVVRDLEPHIMPSPELHNLQGHPGLEHINEGVDAQWTKCTALCGPKSKPDVCHGLSRFAFTLEEREKLLFNNTSACETMVFPFYICEAKCFDRSIEESELQALYNASVAGNTVIELYQKISAAEELDRRILAFSVSHNQRMVKIFGHFAVIDGSNITFHRYRVFEADIVDDASKQTRPYQIALGIWEHFYPIHIGRIRDALARQGTRAMESFTAQLDLEGDPHVSTPSSSQEDSQSKRPSLSSSRIQRDNELLREQLLSLIQEQAEQRGSMERQMEQLGTMMERQLTQQKEESREHLARQRDESRKQMAMMEEQLAQQKEQLAQQKEQLAQQKEIIAMLKTRETIG